MAEPYRAVTVVTSHLQRAMADFGTETGTMGTVFAVADTSDVQAKPNKYHISAGWQGDFEPT